MTHEASQPVRRPVIKMDSDTEHPGGRVHVRLDAITSAQIQDGYAVLTVANDPREALSKVP
ncbi:MAG TPA: hypothetical protein VGN75_04640 [Kaistia sp.]|nr:hypothetical protein [Kaistia sp.]